MPPLSHRAPGLVGAVLQTDEIAAEIICDGAHVHPALIRTAIADSMSVAEEVRKAVARSDKDQAVFDFHTMDEYLQTSLASRKLTAVR